MAVVPYGRGAFLVGVRLRRRGRHHEVGSHLAEGRQRRGPTCRRPLSADGKVYVLNDAGQINCFDLKTGDELWTAELPKNRNKYYASPVLAGDKLYCAREDGVVFVGQVSDAGFKQLGGERHG